MDMFKNYYDPCPLDPSPKWCGLERDWKQYTYVNPPYSNPLPWVEKAIKEMKNNKFIVMLLRCDSSTKYWQLCNQFGEILYFEEE